MGFEPARPRYTLPLAGKEYELLGTFGLIEAVEYAMKENIGDVALNVFRGITFSDLAKVLSAVLTASGVSKTPADVGTLLFEQVGAVSEDLRLLRLHLYCFLCICLAPPGQRESKAAEMGELMGKETAPGPSPGNATAASASAS